MRRRYGNSGDLGEAARQLVAEPLVGEHAVKASVVNVRMSGFDEPWELIVTEGKSPPYGILKAGRILLATSKLPPSWTDPLAGLRWVRMGNRPVITHIWVDPDVQRRGVGTLLLSAYKASVSTRVVMIGPFSDKGLAFAKRSGARIAKD